jgi:hypothetical protein
MRRHSATWERAAEVRNAAEGWLRARAVDQPTYEAIKSEYPDPCVTPSAVWRVLTAVLVTAVSLCTLGAVWVAAEPGARGLSLLLLVFAGASFTATECLEASPRLARRGAAGATAFWGSVFLLVGLGLFILDGAGVNFDRALDAVLLAGALVWALACWRWGNPLFAGLSAISLFLFLGRLPLGRVLWVLVGSALVGLAARRSTAAAWPPSHRRASMIMLVIGVAAVYAAVNVYSLDEQLLENLRSFAPPRIALPRGLLLLTTIATALLPLMVLGWALRSRRAVLLDAGIVLLALSLVTLRHYVHVAPIWMVLTAAGAGLIGLALVVERALRRSPGGERAGFTADVLFSDEQRQHVLQTLPVVAAFTPAASAAPTEEKGFAGRGGAFGGGGASDKF